MGLQQDLVGAATAAGRKLATEDLSFMAREGEVRLAKMALEAAALAETTGAPEVEQALAEISAEITEAGGRVGPDAAPVDVLRGMLAAVTEWRRRHDDLLVYQTAYGRIAVLAAGLERDFTAAGTDTSQRIAARIHVALEECAELLGPLTDDQEA